MRKLFAIIVTIVLLMSCAASSYAHPGRTDTQGGHWDKSTGTYHYHSGGSASSTKKKTQTTKSSTVKSNKNVNKKSGSGLLESDETDTLTKLKKLAKAKEEETDSNIQCKNYFSETLRVTLNRKDKISKKTVFGIDNCETIEKEIHSGTYTLDIVQPNLCTTARFEPYHEEIEIPENSTVKIFIGKTVSVSVE